MVVAEPEALISGLRKRGLDASRATSIAVVEAPGEHPPPSRARRMMAGVVFLPVYPAHPPRAFDAMLELVNDSTAGGTVEKVTLP